MQTYSTKLSSRPLDSPEFKTAINSLLNPIFRKGWDKRYEHRVNSHILSNGKTVEGIMASAWHLERDDFVAMCTFGAVPDIAFSEIKKHKLTAFPDNGKLRLVTLGSCWQHLLAPLHHTIYSVLTSTPNVLRGEPLPSTFANMVQEPGVYLSGDYEASTDNLSTVHAVHILRFLRSRSTHIPDRIWDLAEALMSSGKIWYTDTHKKCHRFDQNTGQLMGNYLSFPLLCISNLATVFLAFGQAEGYRMMKNGLVVVNGDDLVMKVSAPKVKQWFAALPKSGFVINLLKTGIHKSLFTLNSKLFRGGSVKVRKLWHFVPKGIFKKTDITKTPDVMAAHAAVVRENVRQISSKVYAKVVKALASVKRKASAFTSVKTLAGLSDREYSAWPKEWKTAERMVAYEQRFNPIKERQGGKDYKKIYEKKRQDASREEIRQSPYLCAESRFHCWDRGSKTETNDRIISNIDVGYFACPCYAKRKEEDTIWVRQRPLSNQRNEFILSEIRGDTAQVWDIYLPVLAFGASPFVGM